MELQKHASEQLSKFIGINKKPIDIPIPKGVEDVNMDTLEDPKLLRNLPENYDVVFNDPDTAGKMHEFARKLANKHRNWSKERVMRKCFEEYPSTRIRIK